MKSKAIRVLLVSGVVFGAAFLFHSCKKSLSTTKGNRAKVKSSGRIGARKDQNRHVWGK